MAKYTLIRTSAPNLINIWMPRLSGMFITASWFCSNDKIILHSNLIDYLKHLRVFIAFNFIFDIISYIILKNV